MRLAFRQTHLYRFVNMAEMEGFEPPDGLTRQLISRVVKQPKPPCIFAYLLIGYLRKAL